MLIERESIVEELSSFAAETARGRGKVVLVSAEAGGGKTSLLGALREICRDSHKWVWGGCDALITPRVLGPVHDMATGLGPVVTGYLQDPSEPALLYKAVLDALEEMPQPTLLVFEDVHWADHATLDLIKFLGRRISFFKAMLIVTFRDDEITDSHYLRRVLGELPSSATHRVALKPFSQSAIDQLAANEGVDGQGIYEITQGNPFYVTELLAARASSGGMPSSIRDAVAAQHARVADSVRTLLESLSVIPAVVPLSLVTALFGRDVLASLDDALQRKLLVQDERGVVRFRHELARLATLERLSAARKRNCHEQVLNVLIQNKAGLLLDQIVHHAAGALNGELVLKYATQAATAAAQSGAHLEAAAHLATALRFVDEAEPVVAASLYERWAYEASLTARIDDEVLEARRHAITLWRMLERNEKVAENVRALSRMHWYRGEAVEAQRFSDQAIQILESTPLSAEHALAYSLRSQLHMLNDRMDDAVKWGRKALTLAEQFDAVEVRTHALNSVGTALAFRDDPEGTKLLEQSLALSLEHNHHENAVRAYNNLAEYAVKFRRFDLAELTLNQGIAYDIENDLDSWTYYLSGRQAELRLDQGRIDDALTIAQGITDRDPLSLLLKLPASMVRSRALLRLGDAAALAALNDALNDALATDELQHIVPMRLALLEAAWLHDQSELANEHFGALRALSEKDMHKWDVGEFIIWAHRLDQNALAQSEELPEPFQFELKGDFAAAAASWRALSMPYSAALSLAQSKDEALLSEAIDTFEAVNAQAGVARVQREFKRLGLSSSASRNAAEDLQTKHRGPYKGAKNHPLGLTNREQEILKLLAGGFSNREISDQLQRSQRTVENHVSSVLSKLNATSRIAAVLRVQDEPWLLN